MSKPPVLNAYLFSWSPGKWPWPEIGGDIASLAKGKAVSESWTCASYKKIKPGDRAFFVRVAEEPKGIFASGYISSEPFMGRNRKGNDAWRIEVSYDALLDPAKQPILTLDLLNIGQMARQLWTPQSCGISIKPEVAAELEALWQDFLENGHTYL